MTLRPFRLTRQAEATLHDIARWTLHRFGPRQADAYAEDLIDRCEAIAAGAAASRACCAVFDAALDTRLRFTRCASHFIIFIERPDSVIVVDFLHVRTDVPHRLADAIARGEEG